MKAPIVLAVARMSAAAFAKASAAALALARRSFSGDGRHAGEIAPAYRFAHPGYSSPRNAGYTAWNRRARATLVAPLASNRRQRSRFESRNPRLRQCAITLLFL
jgi:hypothetical protein